jgi:hypothetical protein
MTIDIETVQFPPMTTSISMTIAESAAASTTLQQDNTPALIGGIVGGIVALLLIAGVIAFVVMRRRKASHQSDSRNDHSLQPRRGHDPAPAQSSHKNYDAIPRPPSNYNVGPIVIGRNKNDYESLSPSEVGVDQ